MRSLFVFFIAIATIHTTLGQHGFGVKGNIGVSTIKTENIFVGFISHKLLPKLSGQIGMYYNYTFKKTVLGAELFFSRIEGKEQVTIENLYGYGNGQSILDVNYWRHFSYLSLPLYVGFNFNRFNVNIGFQTNFLLAKSADGQIVDEYFYDKLKLKNLEMDAFDFGPRLGAVCNLSDKFAIEANAYYGLNNVLKNSPDSYQPVWKIKQATVGVRYRLFSSK